MIKHFIKSLLTFVLVVFFVVNAQSRTATVQLQQAIFSGGSFWSLQPPFDTIPGVIHTEVGFTGGFTQNPSYDEVATGRSGHVQAIRVIYDPKIVTYETLVNIYWQNIDPWDATGQFCNRGPQYVSTIFYSDPRQKDSAQTSLERISQAMNKSSPVATQILPAKEFFRAEEFHQKFYLKNTQKYNIFVTNCERDKHLKEVWSKAPAQLFAAPKAAK